MQKQFLYILLLSTFYGAHSLGRKDIRLKIPSSKNTHNDHSRIRYIIFEEIEDFPPLGYMPISLMIAVRVTPLLQANPPLAYASLIPTVSTTLRNEDRAFKPHATIPLVREFVSRTLYGTQDSAGNRKSISFNPAWLKAPHYLNLSDDQREIQITKRPK